MKDFTKTEQRAVMHSKVTPEFMDWVEEKDTATNRSLQ